MIAIRLDANDTVGSGHFHRCFPLAVCLRERNVKVTFFCRESLFIEENIIKAGFPLYTIPILSLEEEVIWLRKQLTGFTTILIDGYTYSDSYIEHLAMPGIKVCVIDDDALYTYSCDIVINPHPFAKELPIRVGEKKPHLLLGSKYWIFRPEFEKSKPIFIKPFIETLLIVMGGADVNNYVPVVLQAVIKRNFSIIIVMGSMTKNDAEIREIAARHRHIRIEKKPKSIERLMDECDLAISAGGNTVYELCVKGVPSIIIPQTENERVKTKYMKKYGAILSPGDFMESNPEHLSRCIDLLESQQERYTLAKKAQECVCKGGCTVTAQALENPFN